MVRRPIFLCAFTALLFICGAASAAHPHGFSLEVLVDGQPLAVHPWHGVRYIEAIKGREYAIRLRNPLGVRVAVALSVDGLSTIDARRTTAAAARKWVLGPYETVTISGWQVSGRHARRFYFTSEEESYAERLGRTADLGIISAAFFRERVSRVVPMTEGASQPDAARERGRAEGDRHEAKRAQPAAPSGASDATAAVPSNEEYAATGIGRRTEHPVTRVFVDLEPTPVATIDLRYEYRAQLVLLGVLPTHADPLTRREGARGFEPGFCPEPPPRRPR